MISTPVAQKIRQALVVNDWEGINSIISDSAHYKERKDRMLLQKMVNSVIIEYAFQNNTPEIALSIETIPPESSEELFSLILKHYIKTGDEKWFDILFPISEKLGKKSLQSKIIAFIVKELISAGIAESKPEYIDRGISVLNKINFRKYRSDCIIECAHRITR